MNSGSGLIINQHKRCERKTYMKKAVVVGGSNGIGLSISKQLIRVGYHVIIFDKSVPDTSLYDVNYSFIPCNLLFFDDTEFVRTACDKDVEILMITAGFGRVSEFHYLSLADIHNLLTVNTEAGIKIIKCFYDRLRDNNDFYCGMMGSIAGLVSSPMFSVYAASKAAICRFVESVNIELEEYGTSNRILNVSPGNVKGTAFNGEKQHFKLVENLAKDIVKHLFNRTEIFIPDADIYGPVLERYHADSHEYGVYSFQYKMKSGRVINKNKTIVGYLSGTFDLFHIGHLNLLRRAKEQCDYLIVGIHPNAAHKGKNTFISFEERKQIVASVRYVDKVVESTREDSDAWKLYHYNKLFVGSDYKGTERFIRYEKFFEEMDVEIVYFPYTQGTSSTQIRECINQKLECTSET